MKRFYLICVMIFAVSTGAFCEIYKANAEASFYADKFHGRKTANGEIFNMYDYTAAHKTLPFNSILKTEGFYAEWTKKAFKECKISSAEVFEQVRNFILYYNNFRLKKDLGDLSPARFLEKFPLGKE